MKAIRPTGFLLLKVRARAKRDYQFARGTFHLRQIEIALKHLQERINYLHNRLSDLREQLRRLEAEKEEELKSAVLQQIVSKNLENVPGIGKTLAQEILTTCYDGTLKSLTKAYLYVRGVGEKRQFAINQWVSAIEAQLPRLLNQDFPFKAEILDKYRSKVEQLEQTRKSVEKELSELSIFQREVMDEINWLKEVSLEHFARAYQGDEEARDLVHRYLMGVFPEWDEPPAWFKRLIKEFG